MGKFALTRNSYLQKNCKLMGKFALTKNSYLQKNYCVRNILSDYILVIIVYLRDGKL